MGSNKFAADFMDQVRMGLEAKRNEPEVPEPFTFGDVLHGAIGAGIGAGIAKGVGSLLGVSPRFGDKLETAAMGVGAAMNLGYIKGAEDEIEKLAEAAPRMEQQRKHAFRMGFLKAAYDLGVFKTVEQKTASSLMPVPALQINPAGLLAIPRGVAKGVSSGAGIVGTLLGMADAPNEDDHEITQLQVEKALMEEQLEKLRADKRNRELRKVLAKRQPTR